jgi:hypothetical protein
MASANSTFTDIVSTTLRHRRKKFFDNVTKNNALLTRCNSKGNLELVPGGRSLVEELDYAENSTYKRYSGYEVLDITPSDTFSAAEFDWKQVAIAVSISGLEQLKNSGRDATINLLKARMKNAERTLANNMSTDIYSDGTADGSKQIGGLQKLVAQDPTTGTVGGIDRASFSFWRNQTWDCDSDGSAAMSKTTALEHFTGLWLKCTRGTDKPDLIVCDNNFYEYFLRSLQDIQRIGKSDVATAGFQTVKFITADVVLDGGYGGAAPGTTLGDATGCAYFLNTDYIRLRTHSKRNMTVLSPDRHSVNQDAMVRLIGWAGNMTLSNAFVQGVMFD